MNLAMTYSEAALGVRSFKHPQRTGGMSGSGISEKPLSSRPLRTL